MNNEIRFYICLVYAFVLSMWSIYALKTKYRLTYRDVLYLAVGMVYGLLLPQFPQ